jgi:threonine dehydrogenase-like Zn-dependent dehydrogenase
MTTQRVAVVTGPREVELREIPRQVPGSHEVLIKIEASALCTWEQRTYSGVDQETNYSFVGGHEYAGSVVELGPDVRTSLEVGDRVAIGPQNLGPHENQRHLAFVEGLWGPFGLGEYRAVPIDRAFRLGGSMPITHGCFAEPMACVIKAMDKMAPELGDDVAVIGAGVIGLLHMHIARLRGARVTMVDLDADRRAFATQRGADAVVDPAAGSAADSVRELTGGKGADFVIVAVGNHHANLDALEMVADSGTIMLFASAHPTTEIPIDPNVIHRRQLTITGTRHPSIPGFRKAIDLMSKGLVDVEPLIQELVPLDEIGRAFELSIRPDTYRIIVTM